MERRQAEMKTWELRFAKFDFATPKLALLAAILAWLAATPAGAVERGVLPMARDFTKVARDAAARRAAILVLFSSAGCHYCAQVRDGFLIPTTRNADYDDKVVMVEIDAGSTQRLVDFDGRVTTHAEFASRYQISMTPTIKFLDTRGREVALPLVGIANPDFYGGPLDEAIHAAQARVRGEARTAAN
ncbi:thioredoxin family protein [Thiobacter aerophilum]|uniref:Thioredoxin fold domain-containing protein n=1 Tax=Thiobacter aerophilum TaxID=3121275 RepID=A0ABV0ED98_9BURK